MIGEVGFADDKQPGHIALQFVVHPKPAHRVVDRGINTHRCLVSILTRNVFIHLEKIAVTLADGRLAQTFDRVGKVHVNPQPARTHPTPLIADFLGRA